MLLQAFLLLVLLFFDAYTSIFRNYQRGFSSDRYQIFVPKYLIRFRNGLFLVPEKRAEVPYKVPEWLFFGTKFLC